jgi:hypothetical protein
MIHIEMYLMPRFGLREGVVDAFSPVDAHGMVSSGGEH